MTEETESLVLEQLRRIRASMERMELDFGDFKIRMSNVEQTGGQLLTSLGQIHVSLGQINSRIDRLDERVGRIERRLDLVDA